MYLSQCRCFLTTGHTCISLWLKFGVHTGCVGCRRVCMNNYVNIMYYRRTDTLLHSSSRFSSPHSTANTHIGPYPLVGSRKNESMWRTTNTDTPTCDESNCMVEIVAMMLSLFYLVCFPVSPQNRLGFPADAVPRRHSEAECIPRPCLSNWQEQQHKQSLTCYIIVYTFLLIVFSR